MYDFYVTLGCFGLRTDDFISCGGVENTILKVNPKIVNYNEMMDYFDQCRLFDKAMFDLNSIRHFVHNLNERFDQVARPLWTPKKYELYQKFIIEHRHCGLILKLTLPEESVVEPEEPLYVSNKGSEVGKPPLLEDAITTPPPLHKNNLRLLRGRR